MRPFGWSLWESKYQKFRKSNWTSLERWGLSCLHSRGALEALAESVATELSRHGVVALVSVESVWIDGTPQAIASTHSGKVQCELADLLFILDERDLLSKPVKLRGLLIQAKATAKYNKLSSGDSTKKERRLLEDTNRSLVLELYRDIAASSSIGSYILGGGGYGLSDCARYCLMPKSSYWSGYRSGLAPFQIGWPASRKSTFIRSPRGVVQAIQEMALKESIGREIINPAHCDWSRLVRDLLGSYRGIVMRGYNQQNRVNSSGLISSFVSANHATEFFPHSLASPPPNGPLFGNENAAGDPPAISVLKVNIHYANPDVLPRGDA